jgi:hypothetical protein
LDFQRTSKSRKSRKGGNESMKRSVRRFSTLFVLFTFIAVSASFVAPHYFATAKAWADQWCTLRTGGCKDENGCSARSNATTIYYCGPVDDCQCKSMAKPKPAGTAASFDDTLAAPDAGSSAMGSSFDGNTGIGVTSATGLQDNNCRGTNDPDVCTCAVSGASCPCRMQGQNCR